MTSDRKTPAVTSEPWFAAPCQLGAIKDEIWQRLKSAPRDRNSGWRLPAMATGGSNSTLRQRIVVLREVDAESRTLFAHTDVRSGKVSAIREDTRTTLLFYDPSRQVQLQLTGRAAIHTDDAVAERFWSDEPAASLRGYLAPIPPGTICANAEVNLPEDVQGRVPQRHEVESGRQNFGVISFVAETVEWLLLQQTGNLRAIFEYSVDGWNENWLAP